MKLTSGVKKRIRQQSALERRLLDIEFYEKTDKMQDKVAKRKLAIAKRDVANLEKKLAAW